MYFRDAALICLATVFWALPVSACEDKVALDRAQTIDLINQVSSEGLDPLTQFFAFETLMCSDQAGIRDLALRTGLNSKNPTVHSYAIASSLMEKETMPIKFLEVDGLTKDQYEFIKSRPVLNLAVSFRDRTKGCLSFHDSRECDTKSVMSINGTRAAIRIRWNGFDLDGDFRFIEGALRGSVSFLKDGLTYPAVIELI